MARLPSTVSATPVAPHIIIYDEKSVKRYEYKHEQLEETGRRDFFLKSWDISLGINSDHGTATIVIEDNDAELAYKIKPDWRISISLGRTTSTPWFYGVILEPRISRPGNRQQDITVSAQGYISTLSYRHVILDPATYQGIMDIQDGMAKLTDLAKAVFHHSSQIAPPPDSAVTTTGIIDNDLKINTITKNLQSQNIVLAELANVLGAVYGMTPNRDVFFRIPQNADYVVSNDLENTSQNLALIRNESYDISDTALRARYSTSIGVVDTEIATAGSTFKNFARSGYATKYTRMAVQLPNDAIQNLQIYVDLNYTPPANARQFVAYVNYRVLNRLSFRSLLDQATIINDNYPFSSFAPRWVTLPSSLRDRSTLDAEGTKYLQFGISVVVLDAANQRIESAITDAINAIRFPAGNGQYYGSNGSSPIPSVSGNPFRWRAFQNLSTISGKTHNIAHNTKATVHRELILNIQDSLNQDTSMILFAGILNESAKYRRSYGPISTSIPDGYPPLGHKVTFRDTLTGTKANPVLIGVDIGADYKTQCTAISMTLELQELITG